MLHGLSLLNRETIVHSDLKSENVLIELDYKYKIIKSVKIIDFGSSFRFRTINKNIQMTTPEYLPPEILEFIEFK